MSSISSFFLRRALQSAPRKKLRKLIYSTHSSTVPPRTMLEYGRRKISLNFRSHLFARSKPCRRRYQPGGSVCGGSNADPQGSRRFAPPPTRLSSTNEQVYVSNASVHVLWGDILRHTPVRRTACTFLEEPTLIGYLCSPVGVYVGKEQPFEEASASGDRSSSSGRELARRVLLGAPLRMCRLISTLPKFGR